MMKKLAIGILFLLSLSHGWAQSIGYVDITNGNDTANGASWATAYKTLTNAFAKAVYTNFCVAQGTYYTPTEAGTDIKTNHLYGGYRNDGSGTRDWTSYPTILSGGGSNRVLRKTVAGTSILDGLHIVNGTNSADGGGLNSVGALNMYNCVVSNNVSGNSGGAIYHDASGVNNIFSNCTFLANRVRSDVNYTGGAFCFNSACTSLFQSCTFVTNRAPNTGSPGGFGGAIRAAGGLLRFADCVFSNNYSGERGGAIYSLGTLEFSGVSNVFYGNNSRYGGAIYHQTTGASNVFSNCTFTANAGSQNGGAMHFDSLCTNRIINCAFITNSAGSGSGGVGGGAIDESTAGGRLTLTACTFLTNTATGAGGAIYSRGTLDLSGGSNVFYGNQSSGNHGGAIYHVLANADNIFSNCTFTANRVPYGSSCDGGAIYISAACTNTFGNCSFVTNSARLGGAIREYTAGGLLVMTGCAFSNNVSPNYSGGALSSAGTLRLFDTVFSGNRGSSSQGGGAIVAWSSGAHVFSSCTFVSNNSTCNGGDIRGGGAITFYNAPTSTFMNCRFAGNTCTAFGGAISTRGTLMMFDTVLSYNQCGSDSAGGAIYHQLAGAVNVFSNCTFTANKVNNPNNSATSDGGAIYFHASCTNTFANCGFVTNSARQGGAIRLSTLGGAGAGKSDLINCTFFANVSPNNAGGAIQNDAYTLNLTNCIFWGNASVGTGTNINNGGTVNIGYCDIATNAGAISGAGTKNFGSGIINVDPLFASTVEPYDVHEKSTGGRWTPQGRYADSQDSPCIDAGDPAGPCDKEVFYSGGRVNLGRYGNTPEAAQSPLPGFLFMVQ